MKFLSDENIPAAAVHSLREAGFDVAWIAESNAGLEDRLVLD